MDLTLTGTLLERFIAALLIGILVGMEREWSGGESDTSTPFAGIRTFPLISLGGFTAAFATEYAAWSFAAGFLFLGGLAATSHFVRAGREGDLGTTTPIAALVVYLLGGLCYWNELVLAGATAVIVTLILSQKIRLHGFVRVLDEEDIQAIILFGVITVVALPILPNRDLGPGGLFNPRLAWLMVVFISGISFAGYGLSKILGSRVGIIWSGILGGLASSTAVTLSFTHRCGEEPDRSASYATAIALATTTLYPRILLIIWVWSPDMLRHLGLPFLVLFAAGIIGSNLLWRSPEGRHSPSLTLTNPLDIGFALKFGLLFALILALVRGSYELLGTGGVYATGFVAGLEGLDAITLSVGRLVPDTITTAAATVTLLLAVLANTLVKAIVARAGGTAALYRRLLPFFGVQAGLALLFLALVLLRLL